MRHPPSSTEVSTRRIGLVLALSLILVSSADAQQHGKVWRIGILSMAPAAETPVFDAFRKALQEVINLKTAKALGLTIPPSLLAREDQVIE